MRHSVQVLFVVLLFLSSSLNSYVMCITNYWNYSPFLPTENSETLFIDLPFIGLVPLSEHGALQLKSINSLSGMVAPTSVVWPAGAIQGPQTIGCVSGGSLTVDVEVFLDGVTNLDPTAAGPGIYCVIHLGRVNAFGSTPCDIDPVFNCARNIEMVYAGADNGDNDVFTAEIEDLPPGIYEYTCACGDNGPFTNPIGNPDVTWIGDSGCPVPNSFVNGRLTVDEATPNDECSGTLEILSLGSNTVDNLCSVDGLVGFEYTTTASGKINITATNSGGGVTNPVITVIRRDNACSGTTLSQPICVPPGTTLFFQAGDDETCPEYGEFNLAITQNVVDNDICDDATALNNFGGNNQLNCGEAGSFNGNIDACPDSEASCFGATTDGVWYSFTTGEDIRNFSITTTGGGVYELFAGASCGTMVSLGCAITGLISDPNTSYFLLVGPSGTVTVTSDNNTPANNICSNATPLPPAGLSNQTNICGPSATLPDCGLQGHVVWYQFTMPANHRNLEITISPSAPNAIQSPSMALFSGSCASLVTEDTECGVQLITTCLIPGETYFLAIGSSSANAGNFNLDFTSSSNGVSNDLCVDATPITIVESCQFQTVSGTTLNACPETFTGSFCDLDQFPTVWYSIVLPADGIGFGFQNVTGSAHINILSGACNSLTQYSNCVTDDDEITGLTPGTYLIAVRNTDPGSDFSFEIKNIVPPDNDLCADAATVMNNVFLEGTTACATPAPVEFCGLNTSSDHVVYFSYTVNPANTTNTRLEITMETSMATTGEAADDLNIEFFSACPSTILPVSIEMGDPCMPTSGLIILECLAPGTQIIIAVGSVDGDEGDFRIRVTENDNLIPDNDLCTAPEIISGLVDCQFETINGDNTNACPENIDGGTCNLDINPTVWYSITLPADAVGLSFADLSAGLNIAIFQNNCAAPGYSPSQIGNCITGDIDITTGLTGGSTYLIAVSSAAEGPFNFDIQTIVPPDNDNCGDAQVLTISSTTEGTTACATPWSTAFCGLSTTQDHVVFYTYTVNPANTKNTRVEIEVNASTNTTGESASDIRIQFYENCTGTLLNPSIESGDPCDMLGSITVLDCMAPGTQITIAVGSSSNGEGDFSITVSEDDNAIPDNDLCNGAEDIAIITDCIFQVVNGDNTNACPEDIPGNPCNLNIRSTVWHTVTVGTDVTGLEFRNLSAGINISVYDGTTCTPPGFAPNQIGNCITGNDQITTGIVGGNTYLIAISTTEPNEGPYNFEIRTIAPPPNDECQNAVALTNGSGTDGSTVCATPEMPQLNAPSCPPADQTNTVFYSFTIPDGFRGMEITINSAGSSPVAGNINIAVFETASSACDISNGSFVDDDCITPNNTSDVFTCVGPGTYVIRIATSDDNAGTFSITAEYLPEVQPNDLCINAEPIDESPTCEFFTVSTTSTVDACPEEFIVGGCAFDFSENAVVWYSFTTPSGTISIEIEDIVPNGFLAVFDGCPLPLPNLLGTGCYSGNGTNGTPILVDPNTTYYIAIGLNNAEGDVFFDIRYNLELENDDPCSGVAFTPVLVNSGTPVTGQDNTCATEDDEMCSNPDIDKTVWFEFTVTAPNNSITINVTGTGSNPLDNPAIAVFDNVGAGTANVPCTNNPINAECDFSGVATFNCLNPGTYLVQIGTTEDDAGEFSITITQNINDAVDNDLCSNAEPIDIDELCVPIELTGTNIDACPEDLPPGSFTLPCDFNSEETSWYIFTAPGDPGDEPTMDFTFTNYTGSGNPFFGVFQFGTDCSNLTPLDNICRQGFNTFGNIGPFTPGQQYFIAISSIGDTGGDFEFTVKFNLGPLNDDPCSSEIPINYVIPTDGGSVEGTTLCAGGNPTFPDCPTVNQENVVFFEITIPADVRGVNLTIVSNNVNGTGIPAGSPIVIGIMEDACGGNTYIEAECLIIGQDHDFLCLEPGTYNIQISTSAANEGDFRIIGTVIEYTTTCDMTINHDDCDNALPIVPAVYCEEFQIEGCNQQACPERFTFTPDCPFNTMPVVWYSVTIDPDVVFIDITGFRATGGAPFMAIFEDNGCEVPPTAITNCITDAQTSIPVEEGNTYFIAVGVDSPSAEGGDYEFFINFIRPPENDDPFPDSDRPPLDLTGGASHEGTTCCAIGYADDPNLDYPNLGCNVQTHAAAVWYTYTVGSEQGIEINVGGGTIVGNTTVEVLIGDENAPSGLLEDGSFRCGSLPHRMRFGCLEEGSVIWVKVASTTANCGSFTIQIEEAETCEFADTCDDVTEDQTLITAPTDLDCGEFILRSIAGCIDLACPGEVANCGHSDNPTVWMQIETDENAVQLITFIETSGSWQPVWSIWAGECDNLELLTGGTIDEPTECSNGNSNPDQHNVGIPLDADGNPQTTFYIQISAEGIIDDPNFTLSAFTQAGCVSCIGNEACNPEATFEIINRSSDRELDDLLFCQGETVEICINFIYDPSETGVDWFHGLIPDFGRGWDLDLFDPDAVSVSPGGAEWYTTEDGECAPYITERMPYLCAYTDPVTGVYKLCHILCQSCPCTPPLEVGTPLPDGWFWNTNGGAGCQNTCNPATRYGVPGSNTPTPIEICMTLTTREFESTDECNENRSLRIRFITTSDGVSGCWNDPVAECRLDVGQVGPAWAIDCTEPVRVEFEDVELCNEGTLNVVISTQDGSTTPIFVEPIPNPFVTGMNSYEFPTGFGTITDMLTNTSNTVQIAEYEVWAQRPEDLCPGPRDTLRVTIYPQLEVDFEDIFICYDECGELIPIIVGGTGNYIEFQWSNGETTPTITVCPLVSTTYFVTVTDDLGCTGTGEVELEVKDEILFEISPNPIELCRDNTGNQAVVSVINVIANGAFGIFWDIPPGLGGQPIGGTTDIILRADDSQPGEYELCATVVDQFACENTFCSIVTVVEAQQPEWGLVNALECGDLTARIYGLADTGVELLLFDCDGNLLEQGAGPYWEFEEVDLNNCSEYTLVASTGEDCAGQALIELNIITGEQVEVSGPVNVCDGEEALIEVTNPGLFNSFLWNTGATTQSITELPDAPATIYRVTVTESNGCTSVAQWEVNVQDAPTLSLSGSTSFCEGSSSTLTASASPPGGVTFNWLNTDGDVIGTNAEITISEEGTYTLVGISAIGCSTELEFTIVVDANLNPSLNNVTLCDNTPDTLNAGGGFSSYLWSFDGEVIVGEEDQRLEVTMAGIYCVTVTDGAGCSGDTCRTVVNNTTPVISVVDTIEVCRINSGVGPTFINFNDQVTGSGGTWTNLDGVAVDLSDLSNVSFIDIPTGFYRFRYRTNTAVAPCQNVEEIMVVRVRGCPCPNFAITATNLCNDNGTVDLNNRLSGPNVSGSWSVIGGPEPVTLTGSVFNATGLMAGTYTVQFEIAPLGDCETQFTGTVTVFDAPFAAITINPVLCNETGGPQPTTVNLLDILQAGSDSGTWTQVAGDPVSSILPLVDVEGMAPQVLSFTYTTNTAMGPCNDVSRPLTVTVRDCSCPFVQIETLPNLCNGTDELLDLNDYLTTDPDNLAGTWTVAPLPAMITGGSMFNPFGLPSGSYTFTFSITGDLQPQCQRDFTADLLIRRQPVAEPTTGESPCNEDTGNGSTIISLNTWLSNTPAPSAGVWIQTGGTPMLTIMQPGNMVDFGGTNPGDQFTFQYTTTTANAPCENVSFPVVITVQDCDCPNVATLPIPAICNSDVDGIDLSDYETADIGPGSWSVSNEAGMQIPLTGNVLVVSGLPAGLYTATYSLTMNPGGTCPPSSFQIIRIENQNEADVQPVMVDVCGNATSNNDHIVNFNNFIQPGSAMGTWQNTDGAPVDLSDLSAVNFEGASVGTIYTFTYVVNSESPCEQRLYTVMIEVIDCSCLPINPIAIPLQCTGIGILDLNQFNDPNRPGVWSSTDAAIVINNNTVDISNLQNGVTYSLTYTINDPEPNCPVSVNRTFMVLRQVSSGSAIASYEYCVGSGESISLFDLLEGQDAGGTWREVSGQPSVPGAFNAAAGTFNGALNNAVGTYTFEYFFDGQAPCMDVSTLVRVIANGLPTVDVGPSRLLDCTTESVMIGGQNTASGPDITYLWTHDGGQLVPNANQRIIEVDFPGLFTLLVTNTATGCINSATVQVDTDPNRPSAVIVSQDVSCFGASDGRIEFTQVTGGQQPLRYSIDNGSTFQTSPIFANLGPGNYPLLIVDATGCEFRSSATLTQPDLFTFSLGTLIEVLLGESVTLTLEDKVNVNTAQSITWTESIVGAPPVVICEQPPGNCSSLTVTPDNNTTICATVVDENGCPATDCVQIVPEKVRNVVFPNIIRPGSGQNEFFNAYGTDINRILRVSIYDRWGNLIYVTDDLEPNQKGVGWDGKFKKQGIGQGVEVVPGVYTYLVELEFNPRIGSTTPERQVFTGDVTVVR
jgi:hypothetical protein